MNKVIEMTVNHVNERIQFGRPLSAFQVVQHMCVDMFMKAETSRYAAYYAAWLTSEGVECEKEAAIAKAWCGEAFKEVTKIAHQVTGAIGFTEEYDSTYILGMQRNWSYCSGTVLSIGVLWLTSSDCRITAGG